MHYVRAILFIHECCSLWEEVILNFLSMCQREGVQTSDNQDVRGHNDFHSPHFGSGNEQNVFISAERTCLQG